MRFELRGKTSLLLHFNCQAQVGRAQRSRTSPKSLQKGAHTSWEFWGSKDRQRARVAVAART